MSEEFPLNRSKSYTEVSYDSYQDADVRAKSVQNHGSPYISEDRSKLLPKRLSSEEISTSAGKSDIQNKQQYVDSRVSIESDIRKNSNDPIASSNSDQQERTATFDMKPLFKIPRSAYFILVVEFCERLCFYAATLVLMLYMLDMFELDNQTANLISNVFLFWCYTTPLIGGYIADAYWGKSKTILVFAVFYACGMILLTFSAVPFTWMSFPQQAGATPFGLFLAALFLIGAGTGGIKSNVSTLIADQLGECSNQDIERVYRWFYWAINAGALIGIGFSPSLHEFGAKKTVDGNTVGTSFWASFVFPTIAFIIGLSVFIGAMNTFIVKPVKGSLLSGIIGMFRSAFANRRYRQHENLASFWDYAEGFDQEFVDSVKKAFKACTVFLLFPVYWLLYNQMQSNFITQGTWMDRPAWLTADQLNLVDSLILVLLIPVFDSTIYPFLRRRGFELKAITRIVIGFIIAGCGFIYVGLLQRAIDSRGYFGDSELENYHVYPGMEMVSVWWQIPPYVFLAISEIFSSISALEFAYAQAPSNMKSIVMALFLLTNAAGSAIGIAMSPVFLPKNFEAIFFTFSGGIFALAVVFWKLFSRAF